MAKYNRGYGCAIAFLMLSWHWSVAQGTFVNLNFESPILPLNPSSGRVLASNAIPGWTPYLGNSPQSQVFYDTVSLGGAAVSFQDTNSSYPPIQGDYSVILQPSFSGPATTAALGQTGQIPTNAMSLLFYSGSESMQVTFAGQSIPLIQIGSTPAYLILEGDVSAFAGEIGELRFTMPNVAFSYNIPYLDDIVFSTSPIPEPSAFALSVLGVVGWFGLRKIGRHARR